jgi:S1-C subfamily serine protease
MAKIPINDPKHWRERAEEARTIVTAWNGKPIERVREIMRLLGPERFGSNVDLALIRGGAPEKSQQMRRG